MPPRLAVLMLCCLLLSFQLAIPAAKAQPMPADTAFARFVQGLWPRAQAEGVSRSGFDQATAGLTLDGSLRGIDARQAEFERSLKAYLAAAASGARAQRARAAAAPYEAELAVIVRRTGVPREIILAIWGLESDFGRDHGERDVLRSLASLAYLQPERETHASEFVAALLILQRGLVPRERLKGSWAGAMGDPQFLPSSYLKHAVSFDGRGSPDIWNSVPDTLASIANFLKSAGWRAGQVWGSQTRIPENFSFNAIRQDMAFWTQQGFGTTAGTAIVAEGEAMLFLPVGADGPAFLLAGNFFVLKAYNFSDAYALAACVLGERIAGRPIPLTPWPDEADPLSRSEKRTLQDSLARLGLYKGPSDGRIGPLTRDAVHAFQTEHAIQPADGYPSRAVLNRLLRSN